MVIKYEFILDSGCMWLVNKDHPYVATKENRNRSKELKLRPSSLDHSLNTAMCILETWNIWKNVFSCRKLQLEGFRHILRKTHGWTRLCQGSSLVSPAHLATLRFRKGGWESVFFFSGEKWGKGIAFVVSLCLIMLCSATILCKFRMRWLQCHRLYSSWLSTTDVHHLVTACEGGYVLTLSPMALRASFPSLRTTGLYTVFRYGYATLAKTSVALVLMIHDLKQYCPLRKQESWFGMPFSIIYQLIFHWWLLFDSFINIINQL